MARRERPRQEQLEASAERAMKRVAEENVSGFLAFVARVEQAQHAADAAGLAVLSRGEPGERALSVRRFVYDAGVAAAIELMPRFCVDQDEFSRMPEVAFAPDAPPGFSRYQLAGRWLMLFSGPNGGGLVWRCQVEDSSSASTRGVH